MKTVYEALVAAGPKLEPNWNQHSELKDGAQRAAVAAAEALNGLKMDPTLQLKVSGFIMEQPVFPNHWEGLRKFWKDLIEMSRARAD